LNETDSVNGFDGPATMFSLRIVADGINAIGHEPAYSAGRNSIMVFTCETNCIGWKKAAN
jgi:hypothetical protein